MSNLSPSKAVKTADTMDTLRVETEDGHEVVALVQAAYEPSNDEDSYTPDRRLELISQGGSHSFAVPDSAVSGLEQFIIRTGTAFTTVHGQYFDGTDHLNTDVKDIESIDIVWSPANVEDATLCDDCGAGGIYHRAGYNECVDCGATWGPLAEKSDGDANAEVMTNEVH